MRLEIERKFLVIGDEWRDVAVSRHLLRDGLISQTDRGKVRVRIDVDRAWLTVKGARSGIVRAEYEYEIPLLDAEEMLRDVCSGLLLEKTRYSVPVAGNVWTVDHFHGQLEGVVWAEIELAEVDQIFARPSWIGPEVTADPRFRQSNLLDLCSTGQHPVTMAAVLASGQRRAELQGTRTGAGVLHAIQS